MLLTLRDLINLVEKEFGRRVTSVLNSFRFYVLNKTIKFLGEEGLDAIWDGATTRFNVEGPDTLTLFLNINDDSTITSVITLKSTKVNIEISRMTWSMNELESMLKALHMEYKLYRG